MTISYYRSGISLLVASNLLLSLLHSVIFYKIIGIVMSDGSCGFFLLLLFIYC